MKKYAYYENGKTEVFTESDLHTMWDNEIDQSNFYDYETWLAEMIHMQLLNPIEKEDDTMIKVEYTGCGIMRDENGNTYISTGEDDYCINDATGEKYIMTEFDEYDDPTAIEKA